MAEPEEENIQKQIDEIEAVSSIYEEYWTVVDEAARIFCIRIVDQEPKWMISLQVTLPPEYPTAAPPVYQLNAPWLRGHERAALSNDLEEIYLQNSGECLLFLWVQKIQEFLQLKARSNGAAQHGHKGTDEVKAEHRASSISINSPSRHVSLSEAHCQSLDDEDLPPMVHGDPVTDRRSTFQAHLAPVVTLKQVKMHLQKLYQNKKIAGATHNIYAYRIYCEDKRTFIQDCEDDGETAAGGRMLHLMQILDVRNVMVVVSRWYGGIQLGPDRFKHINNCARNLLVEEGYSEPAGEVSKSKKPKNKKGR